MALMASRWQWRLEGCSDGFLNFESALSPLVRAGMVGKSDWKVYPASGVLEATTQAITQDPYVTHCAKIPCGRCDDLIAGGPILD